MTTKQPLEKEMTEIEYPNTLELAMLAVQSELTNPIKDATNPHF